MEIRIPAYAKINLYLDVINKRKDGFHDLVSIMHSVGLCDYLSASVHNSREGKNINITSDMASIPKDGRNLVWRAAEAFFNHFLIDSYDVEFHIEKNIPTEAGLAGGSADAAAAIKILNVVYNTNASINELCDIGAAVGSDVPFCLVGGTCMAYGRGEILKPIDTKLSLRFVIAKGGEGVSTPLAYKRVDEIIECKQARPKKNFYDLVSFVESKNIFGISKTLYNLFEEVVLYNHLAALEAKNILLNNGAVGALMSGSGPSVFGIFDDEKSAHIAADELIRMGYYASVCLSAE